MAKTTISQYRTGAKGAFPVVGGRPDLVEREPLMWGRRPDGKPFPTEKLGDARARKEDGGTVL